MDRIENDASKQLFFAAGTFLPRCSLATIGEYTDRSTDPLLIRHGPHRKLCVQQFFYCGVYSLPRERVYQAGALQRYEGYTDRHTD
jgi:hypothetical protein